MKRWVAKLAIREALNGRHITHQHGAVLESGGKILAVGSNTYAVKHPQVSIYSTHAEVAVINKLRLEAIRGASIYVARISNGGKVRNSKPCPACMLYIQTTGIRKIFYSIDGIDHWGMIDNR